MSYVCRDVSTDDEYLHVLGPYFYGSVVICRTHIQRQVRPWSEPIRYFWVHNLYTLSDLDMSSIELDGSSTKELVSINRLFKPNPT